MTEKKTYSSRRTSMAGRLEALDKKTLELEAIEVELTKASDDLQTLETQAANAHARYEKAKKAQAKYAEELKSIKSEVKQVRKVIEDLKKQFDALR